MNTSTKSTAQVATLGWLVLFAAVLSQLPALRSWFAQDDWDFLARAAGTFPTPTWPVRPLSTVWSWKLLYSIFGLHAAPYHATALLGFALVAGMTLHVGAKLGLQRAGLAVAALWMVVTPFALRPIAWASASSEIWAAFFALVSMKLWLEQGSTTRPWTLVAGACALLSFAAKESALMLPLALCFAQRWWPTDEDSRLRRGRWWVIALVGVAALGTAIFVAQHFRSGPLDAYSTGGPVTLLRNLSTTGAWLATPWRGSPLAPSLLTVILGTAFWLAWVADASREHRAGRRLVSFAAMWSLGALAPVLALEHHLEAYYLLLATVGAAWWVGAIADRVIGGTVVRRPATARGFVLLLIALTATTGWRTQTVMTARSSDGRIADPIVRRSAIALESYRRIRSIPTLNTTPMVAVLQATRIEIPADVPVPQGGELIVTTPTYLSLRGERGLQLLVPEDTQVRWVTQLDNLPLDTLVLLDAGDESLRILGPLENARMYSALIAAAAGQFPRARHDLWQVIGKLGTEVQFAFRADNLPITPLELDAQAEEFARYLEAEDRPSSRRILRLFAQLYQAVRGRPLIRDDWLRPQRAPRLGG